MAGTIDKRLADAGIELPQAAVPAANYVPTVRSGAMLYISGQVPMLNGELHHQGKLGAGTSVEEGQAAARLCALNAVAQAKAALGGDLDRVVRVVKLLGFVNGTPEFGDQPKVVNGASDLMVEVFGDKGMHARSAVGVASLPFGVAVEVEAILEVAD
ncbi:MAG: RidA family protein [Inquilinus sp.]|nr:RidA family protein [Inquilinus sp.]